MQGEKVKVVLAPPLVWIKLNPGPAPPTIETRLKIVWFKEDCDLSINTIAKKLGVSKRTVREVLEKKGQGRERTLGCPFRHQAFSWLQLSRLNMFHNLGILLVSHTWFFDFIKIKKMWPRNRSNRFFNNFQGMHLIKQEVSGDQNACISSPYWAQVKAMSSWSGVSSRLFFTSSKLWKISIFLLKKLWKSFFKGKVQSLGLEVNKES